LALLGANPLDLENRSSKVPFTLSELETKEQGRGGDACDGHTIEKRRWAQDQVTG